MKALTFFVLLILSNNLSAQLVQASLGPGTASNKVKIYIRPAASQSPANISTIQFNVAVSSSITPKPGLTITSNAFSGVTWAVNEATENGFHHYMITTPNSPVNFNTTANTEMEVMEVEFTGGVGTTDALLVTLPDGGSGPTTGNALFYVTGSLQSDGSNLYYVRSGVAVNNQFSYDETGATSGTSTSTASLGGVTLPVSWENLILQRKNNDAYLDWRVSSDEEISKYIVERSLDGISFQSIGTVTKHQFPGKAYQFIDKNITSLGARIIHYRIRSVDLQNKSTYSDVRNLRLDIKGSIGLYPNPAKEVFIVSIPYLLPDEQRVQLHLVNGLGQVIERRDITRVAAINYRYNVPASVVPGEYLLKIYEDGKLTETKQVLIRK